MAFAHLEFVLGGTKQPSLGCRIRERRAQLRRSLRIAWFLVHKKVKASLHNRVLAWPVIQRSFGSSWGRIRNVEVWG